MTSYSFKNWSAACLKVFSSTKSPARDFPRRLRLLPFFGAMGLSTITPGKVQEYRVNRIATSKTGKAPARSTIHDEVVSSGDAEDRHPA
ncbi:hypothetical protein V1281_000232 [Nitrobacteraceae bacterium AZCC 2161]